MYLRSKQRIRKRRNIALWRILLWVIAPVLIFIGIGIYQNREMMIPRVSELVNSAVVQAVDAVETIQAPTALPTEDPSNNLQRAQAAWSQGAFQESLTLYERVIDAVPNDMQAHYFLTLGFINEGRFQQAEQAAENTVTANPFSSDAWAIRAMALNRTGRYGESIASALRALELNPDSARARAFLAESFFDLGQVERAAAEVEQAITTDPNSFEAYYVRARIRAESQYDFTAAQSDLENAFTTSGKMPYIGVYLATEYIYRNREDTVSVEKGLERLRAMSELNPNNSLVLLELGRYYRTIVGDSNQASTYLTRCVNTVPDAASCHYLLGRVQRDQEQPELAAESFQKAVEGGSRNPQHFYWAADSQLNLGNCAAAAEYANTGYQIAQETESQFLDDLEALIRTLPCGSFDLPTLTPTPTIDPNLTPTPEA
jgi:tetratricopeptide (TPR) repeat protein